MTADNQPIRIWPFEQAPQEYRDLSEHGGDEDWVAHVPAWIGEDAAWRIVDALVPRGCSGPDEYPVDDGVVFIGAHS